MINKSTLYFILLLAAFIILYIVYRKNFKKIRCPSICLITGGVKTGKSLLSVKLAVKEYRKRHRAYVFKKWFRVNRKKVLEEPLFYTNTFVQFNGYDKNRRKGLFNRPHRLNKNIVQIELDHLLRFKRFAYGSVVYICESSLMADAQDYNDMKRNAELSLFNKLFGHETKGGILFYDTQAFLDNHYSIKRCISTFFFIQKSLNLFFFRILYVREMINKDLGENIMESDVEDTMKKVLILRRWYKRYDRYYYSYLTDRLSNKTKKTKFYKGGLVSFNPLYRDLAKGGKKNYEEVQAKKYY